MANERVSPSGVDVLVDDLRRRIAEGRLGPEPLSVWTARVVDLGPEGYGDLIGRLISLNPVLPAGVEWILAEAAAGLGAAAVPVLKQQIGRLILESAGRPERARERELVDEIRARIEVAAHRLLESGDLDTAAGGARADLVLASDLSPRQVVRIEEEACLSASDWRILEGHRNRVELIDTSLLALLRALTRVWQGAAAFFVALCEDAERAFATDRDLRAVAAVRRRGVGQGIAPPVRLDPAIRRDLVIVLGETSGPQADRFIRATVQDHEARREYPRIHREARRPLVVRALRHWHENGAAQGRRFSRSIARLLTPEGGVRWRRVEGLVTSQLDEVARAVQLFLQQGKRLRTRTLASRTLAVEVSAMIDSVHLLLLVSEEFLLRVHGCRRFAEALFGLDGPTLETMRRAADASVRRSMERAALRSLKRHGTMLDFVQSLRLVDDFTRERVIAMLDLATSQFPTLRIKNQAMDMLAVPYQEQEFERRLLRALQKRFRALVRVVHDDALRTRLEPDDFERLQPRREDIFDLYALLVASRDYLASMTTRYENVSDDFVFAEEEYKAKIEGRLIRLLTRPQYGFVPERDRTA